VIALMAGLFYLPRLFVYHTRAKSHGELDTTLKIMERKLLKIIINPALIAMYLTGILLLFAPGMINWKAGWLHGKLSLVLILTGFHVFMVRYQRDFEQNKNKKSEKFFRIINEVPTVIMILIIFLVVLQPF
jgi:putative membrane protein